MKRLLSALAAVLVFVLSGCEAEEIPTLAPSVTASFDTAKVQRGDLADISQFEAYVCAQLHDVTLENAVELSKGDLLVRVGDSVTGGQLLASIGAEQAQDRLDALKTELKELTARHEHEIRLLELELQLLEISGTEAEREITQNNIDYQRSLLELGSEELNEQIALAEEELEDCFVYAPSDGEVVRTAEGPRLEPGAVLLSIADTGDLYVEYSGTTSISSAAKGYEAHINGEVYTLSRRERDIGESISILLAGGVVPTLFDFEDVPEGVRAGNFAALQVCTNSSSDTLYIPENCLYTDSGVTYVYVAEDGARVRRDVETGLRTDTSVEIISGLEEGEDVCVRQ